MTYITRWFIGVGAFVVGFFLMVWLMLGLGGLDPGHNLGISDNFVVYLFYLGGGLVSGSALALLKPGTGSSVVVLAAAVATSAMFLVASWLSGELLTDLLGTRYYLASRPWSFLEVWRRQIGWWPE